MIRQQATSHSRQSHSPTVGVTHTYMPPWWSRSSRGQTWVGGRVSELRVSGGRAGLYRECLSAVFTPQDLLLDQKKRTLGSCQFSAARATPHRVVRRCRHEHRGGLDRGGAQRRGGGRVRRGFAGGLYRTRRVSCSATTCLCRYRVRRTS